MKTPKTSKPRKTAVRCTGWVAELEAELKRRKKLGNMHDSKGNYRGADYHFAFIAGLRFALKTERGRSATDLRSAAESAEEKL